MKLAHRRRGGPARRVTSRPGRAPEGQRAALGRALTLVGVEQAGLDRFVEAVRRALPEERGGAAIGGGACGGALGAEEGGVGAEDPRGPAIRIGGERAQEGREQPLRVLG